MVCQLGRILGLWVPSLRCEPLAPREDNVYRVDQPRHVAQESQQDVDPELPGETDLPIHSERRDDDRYYDPKEIHNNLLLLALPAPDPSRAVRGT